MTWKSKKTLRIESETYEKLWQETEAQLERVQTRLRATEQMAMPAIWVIAKDHRAAVFHLRNRDVHERHPRVRIIVGDTRNLQGARILAGDKVIFDRRIASDSRFMDEIEHTLVRSNLRRDDLWWVEV